MYVVVVLPSGKTALAHGFLFSMEVLLGILSDFLRNLPEFWRRNVVAHLVKEVVDDREKILVVGIKQLITHAHFLLPSQKLYTVAHVFPW
jgi:hypothetical protein